MNSQANQSFRQTMVSGVPKMLTSGIYSDLAPEQLGLFSISEIGNVKVANGNEDLLQLVQGIKPFIAQGSSSGGGFSNAPRKTKSFKPNDIVSFKGIKANKKHQGQKVALGYDGVDASKKLTAMLDVKDLILNVRLWGSTINKVTGNRNGINTQFYVNKGCLTSDCETNSIVAGDTIADSILEQIENSYLTIGYKFKDLIDVKKVKKYANPPAPVTNLIPFHKFEVTICDDGSNSALGLIQSQYNGFKVERVKRLDSNSTYQVWTKDTFTTSFAPTVPVNVSLSARSVADCAVCPSGSTKVDASKAFELKGLFSNPVPVIAGSTSVTLIGTDNLSKTYLIIVPVSASDAIIITSGNTQNYTTRLLSTTRDICNFTATTYSWVQTGSGLKAPTKWKITLADGSCGTDRLFDLQNNYKGFTVAVDASGTCVHTYTLENYSNIVEPECYPEDYVFTKPSAFENIEWTNFSTTLLIPNCNVQIGNSECVAVGLIFESKVEDSPLVDINNYHYEGYYENRVDPVHIEIKVLSLDPNSNSCEEPAYPVTKLQSIVYPRGQGRAIMEREKESLGYELKRLSLNPKINQTFGFVFNAKDGKYYDEYQLGIKYDYKSGGWSQNSEDSYLVSVFFEEGQGKDFENVMNGVIAKNSLRIKPVYL